MHHEGWRRFTVIGIRSCWACYPACISNNSTGRGVVVMVLVFHLCVQ